MKAIVLHEYGGPSKLKLEDVPDPVPGPGEVLVRLTATSVNPVDYKIRSGVMKDIIPVQFPFIPGHDLSGVVDQLGEGVTGFAPGDRVMALAPHTYAQLAVVKAAELILVPEGMDLVEVAALPLVTLTGQQLVSRGVAIQKGQTVLITGALGNVGRSAVWTARKAGAKVIAGVRKKQLKDAAALHADEVIAVDDDDQIARLGFLDAVADTVGGQTAETLIAKVKQGGVFATVVGPPANASLHPTVRVAMVQVVADAALLRTLAEDVHAGSFSIPIDRMIPLEDAPAGQAAAEAGGIGKVLILL